MLFEIWVLWINISIQYCLHYLTCHGSVFCPCRVFPSGVIQWYDKVHFCSLQRHDWSSCDTYDQVWQDAFNRHDIDIWIPTRIIRSRTIETRISGTQYPPLYVGVRAYHFFSIHLLRGLTRVTNTTHPCHQHNTQLYPSVVALIPLECYGNT